MQDIIALVFDSDLTLTPEYMQEPLLKHYGLNSKLFWQENQEYKEKVRNKGINIEGELGYLNLILRKTRQGIMNNLNNKLLNEIGKEIKFYPGIPEIFTNLIKDTNANLEYYIITSGLKELLAGSIISKHMSNIYGCEYNENNEVIDEITRVISYTEKTRYLFEISKGTSEVNKKMKPDEKRIPFKNIIYVGDGQTDVPCFSLTKKQGGFTYAVYNKEKNEAIRLYNEKRVNAYGKADYTKESETYAWLEKTIKDITTSFS